MHQREKLFGFGKPQPLDREAKLRIMTLGRALTFRTKKGKHYGWITAKQLDVLKALLWVFHNAKKGFCYPSLDKLAKAADCARSTACAAIKALEEAGLITWVHRIKRIREHSIELRQWVWRVHRTSNGYQLIDPHPIVKKEQSERRSGTTTQVSFSSNIESESALEASLKRFKDNFEKKTQVALS